MLNKIIEEKYSMLAGDGVEDIDKVGKRVVVLILIS